jgi:cytidylate kinase
MEANTLNYKDFENLNFDPFREEIIDNLSNVNLNIFHETQMNLINTPYFNPFNFKVTKDLNSFSVLHVNIRSMQQNIEKLKEFLSILNYAFDVIALTETWQESESSAELNSNFSLPTYKLISQPRASGKKGGGVAVYVSDKYIFKLKFSQCFSNTNYESLFVEIIINKCRNILIGCVYRPPNGKIKPFENFIKKTIIKINKENKSLYIIGDTNLDALTYQKFPKTKSFFDMLFKYNVLSVINKPTRVSKTSATAIDNFFINNYLETTFETGIFQTDISDHFPIFLKVNYLKTVLDSQSNVINLKKRKLNLSNINELTCKLKQETWKNVYKCKDTNEAFNTFLSKLLEHYNETCPYEDVKIKAKAIANPWMNKQLLKCSKKKQKLYNKFLKNKNTENEQKYKKYKTFYQILIKNAKKSYYSMLITKNQSNSKKTWSIINDIIGKDKNIASSLPQRINIENTDIFCQNLIAKEFNKYFTNVGPKLANKIPPSSESFKSYLKPSNDKVLYDNELSYKEFETAFSSLKKKNHQDTMKYLVI